MTRIFSQLDKWAQRQPACPLEPGPFCGSSNVREGSDGWGKVFHMCRDCKAQGPKRSASVFNSYPDEAVWNLRKVRAGE